MKPHTVSNIGRCFSRMVAVTLLALLGLTLFPARAEVTRKWTFDVPRVSGSDDENVHQIFADGAGGVAVVYETSVDGVGQTGRRLLWLDDRAKVLADVPVGRYAEISKATKKQIFLRGEFDLETFLDGIRVVYRNGTTDFSTGAYGLSSAEIGNLDEGSISRPFSEGGFFTSERFEVPGEPVTYRLRIVFYQTRKN